MSNSTTWRIAIATFTFGSLGAGCTTSEPTSSAVQRAVATVRSTMSPEISGECVDVPGGSDQSRLGIQQWDCNGLWPQDFDFVPQDDGSYRIDTASGQCLDSWGSSQQVVQYGCDPSDNQKWDLIAQLDHSFLVENRGDGLCLNIDAASRDHGAAVITWNCVPELAEERFQIPGMTSATRGGVPLPAGWALRQADHFGTQDGATVANLDQLHDRYFEAMYYNRDASGRVDLPNVVVNHEQQTYRHFEDVIAFSADHLTIQARGHDDGSIWSGELVSKYAARSFCIEGVYKIPNVMGAWPALWWYGSDYGTDISEIDIEQPITPYQGVSTFTMHNHPEVPIEQTSITSPYFTTQWWNYTDPAFDASATAHTYTACYDDVGAGEIRRYIDGALIYTAAFKWAASLGGTGHGPDPSTLFNLAVGGDWPGNVADPASFQADLDLYSIEYYGP